jgi:hypothetical protein
MTESFWFYDWIDEIGIKTTSDVHRALRSKSGLRDLASRATEAVPAGFTPVADPAAAVVASRAVDLSAIIGCPSIRCQRNSIDLLYRTTWHFFDKIIVEGPSPVRVLDILELTEGDSKLLNFYIEGYVETLLYIREIGGEDMLLFRQKPVPCAYHWRDHLKENGLSDLPKQAESIIEEFRHGGKVVRLEKKKGGLWSFEYKHPLVGTTAFGSLILEKGSTDPAVDPTRAIAETLFKYYAGWLVSDVQTAKGLGLPLGSLLDHHAVVNVADNPEVAAALQLSLPMLEGVPIADLLRIRKEEYDSFVRFRNALLLAIREQSKGSASASPSLVARQVYQEVIQPSLADLSQRVEAAKSILERKSWSSVGIGSIASAIGEIAHIPLLLPAGIAAALMPLAHYHKFLDEQREIELSDMYFLWQIQERAWEFEEA